MRRNKKKKQSLRFVGRPYQEKGKKLFKKPKAKRSLKSKSGESLDRLHDEWFFSLDIKYFRQLNKEWNERNLKIEITEQDNYDAWLNYFKGLPASHIKTLSATGTEFLTTEAYAALSRWHDIVQNPHRIDKIHQSGLTNSSGNPNHKTVLQLASENDRIGVLKATRDKIAEKLDKGAGSRDTALLTKEMTEIMSQIAEYEKRMGPKKTTKVGQLLGDIPRRKRPPKNGKGSRNTSFQSRVTIKDVDDA